MAELIIDTRNCGKRDICPSEESTSGDPVFVFARALKAQHPDADVADLRESVRKWHTANDPDEFFDDVWAAFVYCWPRIRFAKGATPLTEALRRAQASPVQLYDEARMNLLVSVCRELQSMANGDAFFLSCWKAGELIGVDHTTANRWLHLLIHDGVLTVVSPGTARRARRFLYHERP